MTKHGRLRARRQSGFALVEVVVVILIMGVSLMALLQVHAESLRMFAEAEDQHSIAWLAEMKMAQLLSENLPNPEDEETWDLYDSGNFAEFDDLINDWNLRYNERWQDRDTFRMFEYEWKKEIVFIGADFIGSRSEIENWEEPVQDFGQPIMPIDDPREKPAARVVRVTLTVFLPRPPESSEEEERYRKRYATMQFIDGRPALRLVTYVDPSMVYAAAAEEEIPD